MTMGKTINVI